MKERKKSERNIKIERMKEEKENRKEEKYIKESNEK